VYDLAGRQLEVHANALGEGIGHGFQARSELARAGGSEHRVARLRRAVLRRGGGQHLQGRERNQYLLGFWRGNIKEAS